MISQIQSIAEENMKQDVQNLFMIEDLDIQGFPMGITHVDPLISEVM